MKHPRTRSRAILLICLTALFVLGGCGGTSAPRGNGARDAGQTGAAQSEGPFTDINSGLDFGPEEEAPRAQGVPPRKDTGQQARDAIQPAATPIGQTVGFADDPNRKIIKNADLTIEVDDVTIGMSRVNAVAAQTGGYLLDSRTDYAASTARTAVLQIAVPVDKFEEALNRIREVGKVMSEQASGTDVTQEFVDLESKIDNLQATQARIREFLERANSTEQALQINQQLSEIEGQISQLKGRQQFLAQRAAYSTITVKLQQLPAAVTPTPTPTAAPVAWDPGGTAKEAYGALTTVFQAFAAVGIWIAIFVLPIVLPVLAIAFGVRAVRNRARSSQTPRVATATGDDTPASGG